MRVRCLAIALAVTLAVSASAAKAGVIISFDDMTEFPNIRVVGSSANVVMLSPQDFVVILPMGTLPAPTGGGAGSFNDVFGLTSGGSGFSDLVYFTPIPGSTALMVEFVANPSAAGTLAIGSGANLYGSAVATGSFQNIPLPKDLSSLSSSLTIQIGAHPFVSGVPEPSILALAGVGGAIGLGFRARRFRRKA